MARVTDAADLIYNRYGTSCAGKVRFVPASRAPMTRRPWSELTNHWSPERKAANARAEAKLRGDVHRLQAQARKESRHPGDPPSAGSSSGRPQTPIYPVESGLEAERDYDRDFGPSR